MTQMYISLKPTEKYLFLIFFYFVKHLFYSGRPTIGIQPQIWNGDFVEVIWILKYFKNAQAKLRTSV